jgi:16S rRNA (guanine(966)-N(2))-methyltransferase RsmD
LKNKVLFEERSALDLFAGTGAISYEFASRACSSVIAVDSNFQCIRFIKKTAVEFGMESIRPMRSDVFRYLKNCKSGFDLIFADPPYSLENIPQISLSVFDHELLNFEGWLVVEHPKTVDLSAQQYFVEHRRYGHVNFSFFQYVPGR